MVLLDLPATLAPGEATVAIKAAEANIMQPALVQVLFESAADQNQFELGAESSGLPGPIRSH
jgi:hypothetical protein